MVARMPCQMSIQPVRLCGVPQSRGKFGSLNHGTRLAQDMIEHHVSMNIFSSQYFSQDLILQHSSTDLKHRRNHHVFFLSILICHGKVSIPLPITNHHARQNRRLSIRTPDIRRGPNRSHPRHLVRRLRSALHYFTLRRRDFLHASGDSPTHKLCLHQPFIRFPRCRASRYPDGVRSSSESEGSFRQVDCIFGRGKCFMRRVGRE
jgi:hypothetical protein